MKKHILKEVVCLKESYITSNNGFLLSVFIILFFSSLLLTPHSSKADVITGNSASSDDLFSGLTVIQSDELSNMRGGFTIGGTEINIGAIVRTFLDGRLALETQLTVAGSGIITSLPTAITSVASKTSPATIISAISKIAPVSKPTLTSKPTGLATAKGAATAVPTGLATAKGSATAVPTTIASSTGIPGTTVISNNGSSPTLQEVVPQGVILDGLQGSEGVVLNDNRGFTAVLNDVQKNRFLSTVINRASGRIIQHQIDIEVTLKNFQQLQSIAGISRLTSQFSRR